jgi:serine/threonine protein kinase
MLVGALEDSGEHEAGPSSEALHDSSTFSTFTRTGAVLGTPLYMAPEQVKDAADVDLRADIWAFGVVAFQCLTGRPPFAAESIEELFRRIVAGNHPRAEFVEETLPPAFDVWFNVACAPDRDNRYPSAVIAFRQLAVSLGVSVTDDSGRGDPLATSGERRVLVVPDVSPGERPSGPGSIGRLGLRTTDRPPPSPPPPSPSVPLAASRTHDGQSRTSSRGWLVGIVGASVLGALALWTGSRRDAPPPVSSATAAPPGGAPSTTASTAAQVDVAPAPVTASAPSSAVPVPSSKRPPARSLRIGAPAIAPPPIASTSAVGAVAAGTAVSSPAPPPPPPAPAAVPDPGSYR